jgi:hypothetical protein
MTHGQRAEIGIPLIVCAKLQGPELGPILASRKRRPTAAAALATPCGDAGIIDFARNMIAKTIVQTVLKQWVK